MKTTIKFTKKQQLWAEATEWSRKSGEIALQKKLKYNIQQIVLENTKILERYWTIAQLKELVERRKKEYEDTYAFFANKKYNYSAKVITWYGKKVNIGLIFANNDKEAEKEILIHNKEVIELKKVAIKLNF